MLTTEWTPKKQGHTRDHQDKWYSVWSYTCSPMYSWSYDLFILDYSKDDRKA